ncbi:MAG TPA: FAD-dependent oxidoreductase [Verrucomicrobiota bacterium]|jgi:ribulose 1,5-bisphosphate synthetase/thiazole synthase|nr:FAD-dependent oxidoreductase [Verrucomicrobiota bacterium]HQL76824.1 FAD-dependent oxidoreductase [Verrucomicrobiota bacterium]
MRLNRRGFVKSAGALLAGASVGGPALSAAGAGSHAAAARRCDVLVCGGGPAGVAAAVSAARQGAKTLLVERCGRLGGMGVTGLVGPLMGHAQSPFVEEVLRRIGGRRPVQERLDLDYTAMVQEAGGDILLHTWVMAALRRGRRVTGVRALTKQGPLEVQAEVVVDATGDGDVAFLAGAAYEMGRPGDGLAQPVSIQYRVSGVDSTRALLCGSEEEALQVRVPEGVWDEVVRRGMERGELPANVGVIRVYLSSYPNERIINATQVNGIDATRVQDLTRAELEGRKQAFQVLDFLRKHAPGFEHAYISAMPAMIGVRESRRIRGEKYLTRDDVLTGRRCPDAVVWSASFAVDIHNPTGPGQAENFATKVQPYDIPYGCLVPEKTEGLLVAGRCISGSHDAHASYRVQCIVMAIGAAAGVAAALAARQHIPPRKVAVGQIQQALR